MLMSKYIEMVPSLVAYLLSQHWETEAEGS